MNKHKKLPTNLGKSSGYDKFMYYKKRLAIWLPVSAVVLLFGGLILLLSYFNNYDVQIASIVLMLAASAYLFYSGLSIQKISSKNSLIIMIVIDLIISVFYISLLVPIVGLIYCIAALIHVRHYSDDGPAPSR